MMTVHDPSYRAGIDTGKRLRMQQNCGVCKNYEAEGEENSMGQMIGTGYGYCGLDGSLSINPTMTCPNWEPKPETEKTNESN